jgi:hypothetical protein
MALPAFTHEEDQHDASDLVSGSAALAIRAAINPERQRHYHEMINIFAQEHDLALGRLLDLVRVNVQGESVTVTPDLRIKAEKVMSTCAQLRVCLGETEIYYRHVHGETTKIAASFAEYGDSARTGVLTSTQARLRDHVIDLVHTTRVQCDLVSLLQDYANSTAELSRTIIDEASTLITAKLQATLQDIVRIKTKLQDGLSTSKQVLDRMSIRSQASNAH